MEVPKPVVSVPEQLAKWQLHATTLAIFVGSLSCPFLCFFLEVPFIVVTACECGTGRHAVF